MDEIWRSLDVQNSIGVTGVGSWPSCFAVSDLAVGSIGAVGVALSELVVALGLGKPQSVAVDRRLASLWFKGSIQPSGWELPPVWDAIAGDYPTKDGWIRLHTNLPHHREAAVSVLECQASRDAVAAAVLKWESDALEGAVVQVGGVAAAMRSAQDWAAHPQGKAVSCEPLIHWAPSDQTLSGWPATRARPLLGLKVLDLTRVLAGPVATRTLAGFGANVLRIDPPEWDEPNVVPDVTLGKHCARLNLRDPQDRAKFEALLTTADVLVHGYRPGALEALGYGEDMRSHLVDISLDAYGWTGPWAKRRGFDSLVQMSSGIAHAGMEWAGRDQPTPLPVQALDHATGYLMAAATLRLLAKGGGKARLSLARVAELLKAHPQAVSGELDKPSPSDFSDVVEQTPWGPAHRLKPALSVEGTPMIWERAASELGSAQAAW